MKIAIIVPSLANKGPIIVANDLCHELISKGHKVKVYYFSEIVDLDFPCETEKISFLNKIPFNEYDVIHCHSFQSDLYLKLYSKLIPGEVKKITTLHQPIDIQHLKLSFSKTKAIVLSKLWNWSMRCFDNIVTLNNDTLSNLPINIREKATVIFNGRRLRKSNLLPSQELLKRIGLIKKRYRIIGTVSSVDYRKNIEQIIKSLPYLKDYSLIVAGDGPSLNSLKALSSDLGVKDRCLFLGFLKDVSWLYPYFDIFTMCSRSEGFPLSLIEAASNKLPVALSNIPIFKSIMTEEEVVFFDLDDIQSFVNAIQFLELNKKNYSESIFNRYRSLLTPERMCENYMNIYTRII